MSEHDNFPSEPVSFEEEVSPRRISNKATKKAAEKVQVKLVNTTIYDNTYLVYRLDDISQVFLVPTEHLQFSVSPQLIDETILLASEKPYDWNEEINAIWPSLDQVRLAVYRNGLVKREDLADPQLAQMALYGAFPNRFKGD